ncbi:aquaporin-like protein [Karstenula rhodostoma CBS 690.94]|uniref:Aquaporin-like protein n=1 Tax=Karstenula rhodostoma CBS 690.94 TaxID=1392251 RepID=A0A9P4PDS2_9PLEO|nr:aquaporin-like protein [Karstenula rhodostoma CBS 690.94]
MEKDLEKNHDIYPTTSESSSGAPSITARLNSKVLRKEVTIVLGEFVGTFLFLFFAFAATQIALEASTINPSAPADAPKPPELHKLLYIAFAFGCALAVNVAIFADVSGGMFNPAVTAALWVVGLIRWDRALYSVAAQLLASVFSSSAISALLPGPVPFNTVLDPSVSIPRGLFLEMFLTAQLVLTILMLPSGGAKPLYIGMALFSAEMAGVFMTGGSLNPARSFGPAVVVGFQSYDWIYLLGPLLGAALGGGTFSLIKFLQDE